MVIYKGKSWKYRINKKKHSRTHHLPNAGWNKTYLTWHVKRRQENKFIYTLPFPWGSKCLRWPKQMGERCSDLQVYCSNTRVSWSRHIEIYPVTTETQSICNKNIEIMCWSPQFSLYSSPLVFSQSSKFNNFPLACHKNYLQKKAKATSKAFVFYCGMVHYSGLESDTCFDATPRKPTSLLRRPVTRLLPSHQSNTHLSTYNLILLCWQEQD